MLALCWIRPTQRRTRLTSSSLTEIQTVNKPFNATQSVLWARQNQVRVGAEEGVTNPAARFNPTL